jgi:hypothetical protein
MHHSDNFGVFYSNHCEVILMPLPTNAQERKDIPIYSGFIKYFPLAIAEVARLSKIGNDQHNPGLPLFWDRSKSTDELDAMCRHMVDEASGVPLDTDGVSHKAKVAWRAMADLQKSLEAEVQVEVTKRPTKLAAGYGTSCISTDEAVARIQAVYAHAISGEGKVNNDIATPEDWDALKETFYKMKGPSKESMYTSDSALQAASTEMSNTILENLDWQGICGPNALAPNKISKSADWDALTAAAAPKAARSDFLFDPTTGKYTRRLEDS